MLYRPVAAIKNQFQFKRFKAVLKLKRELEEIFALSIDGNKQEID
jgi:hypothetical protein